MATHSSVLAWRIPGMGDPGGLLSVGSHRAGHDWSDLAAAEAASLYYIWSYDLLVHGFIKEFSNTLLSIKLVVVMLVAQSCLTLCDPMDCSPPGSSVHGILQARILEWVAIPFSRSSSWPRDWTWVLDHKWILYRLSYREEDPVNKIKYFLILFHNV